MTIVLDTNALISSIPSSSVFNKIFRDFVNEEYKLAITNEILSEYFEIMEQRSSTLSRNYFEAFFENSQESFILINPQSRYKEIYIDEDDNKFVDCAIISFSKHLVTSDKHILKQRNEVFYLSCIKPEEYLDLYP